MSSSVKLITYNLDVKLRFKKIGAELSFIIGEYFDFEAKNSLKSLNFPLKLFAGLITTFSGGSRGIFVPFKKFFKIDQNVLELVVGSVNF